VSLLRHRLLLSAGALLLLTTGCGQRDEATVYPVRCSAEVVEGRCRGQTTAQLRRVYTAFPARQQVVWQFVNGNDGPKQLPNCVVRDTFNWECKGEKGDYYRRVDGRFEEHLPWAGPEWLVSWYDWWGYEIGLKKGAW
jgi:hypothetical protein